MKCPYDGKDYRKISKKKKEKQFKHSFNVWTILIFRTTQNVKLTKMPIWWSRLPKNFKKKKNLKFSVSVQTYPLSLHHLFILFSFLIFWISCLFCFFLYFLFFNFFLKNESFDQDVQNPVFTISLFF